MTNKEMVIYEKNLRYIKIIPWPYSDIMEKRYDYVGHDICGDEDYDGTSKPFCRSNIKINNQSIIIIIK